MDKVFNRTRNSTFSTTEFQLAITSAARAERIIGSSTAGTPGANSPNSKTFTVQPGMNVLDVFASYDNAAGTGDGNVIGMILFAPNGTTYSSGIALPVLSAPSGQIVVRDPVPGQWRLELRGARGLAAVPA